MKIAICDDLLEAAEELKRLLAEIPDMKEIDCYTEIEKLYQEVDDETRYDIIFMDIDWKEQKTGIDFGEELGKKCPTSRIVYVTAYALEFVENIFVRNSNLSGFLKKPVRKEQLEKLILKIKKDYDTVPKNLVIRQKGTIFYIPFEHICYLENQLHKVKIVTDEKEYFCNESLSQIQKRLDQQFVHSHKSFCVNMNKILEFKSGKIVLKNGEDIPVSKRYNNEAKEKFFQYMSGRL